MTELEQFKAMLARAKIEPQEEKLPGGTTYLSIERGYAGFVVGVEFDPDGLLMDIGAWE
jgi:hypothetical protein